MPLFIDAFLAAINALLLVLGLVTTGPVVDKPTTPPLSGPSAPLGPVECVKDAVDPTAMHCSSVPDAPAPGKN